MPAATGSRLARWRGIARLAGRGLKQRWLESLFILLGIALGVGVFTGMETYIRFQLQLASDATGFVPQLYAVEVMPRRLDLNAFTTTNSPAIRVDPELAKPVDFTLQDVLALRDGIPEIEHVFVSGSGRGYQISAVDGETVDVTFDPANPGPFVQLVVQTMSPDELVAGGRRFLAGTSFSWEDMASGNNRIVLDEEAAAYLFPDLTPDEVVGRTITTASGMEGTVWTIAGVVARQDEGFFVAFGEDDSSFRVLDAYGPMTQRDRLNQLYVTPVAGVTDSELVRQVQSYMDRIYGAGRVEVRPPGNFGGSVGVIVQILALAGLALLIAAINILNLFTARVLRRQRYTGMSIALGATRGMLFWQTAGEAILLGLLGSALGLFFAQGAVRLLHAFLMMQLNAIAAGGAQVDDPYAGLVLTPVDAAIGIALGTGISLLFGLYPAWLAARQDPAEALRAEA